MTRVKDVLDALLHAYPAELAEDWDTGIGLTCGDPGRAVGSVLLAVDADEVTVGEAIHAGAGVLVTHHPLLFRAVQTVAADTAKGALLHRLIQAGVAHIAVHTNADSAVGGVNDALAGCLDLIDLRPLVPHEPGGAAGSGRVGQVTAPLSLRAFAELVATRLPATVGGVRVAGDPTRRVHTVAVCGGAGDSFLEPAARSGADVYLTSDLRHHVVAEYVGTVGNPAVIDVAHWAGEWPWLDAAAKVLAPLDLSVTISHTRTDPWTLQVPSTSGGRP